MPDASVSSISLLSERRGMVLVLSSPSGAGKTSLCAHLLKTNPELKLSVSVTTRPPRSGEIEGFHYVFVDQGRFLDMIERSELIEHARVFDHLYGTPRAPVDAWLGQGHDVLFDVDWQGALQLRQVMQADTVSVFILPPSLAVLQERLRRRAQDTPEVVQKRMGFAAAEIGHWDEYDYVIINDDFQTSCLQIEAILKAERLRRIRNPGLGSFVQDLIQNESIERI